MRQSFGRRIPTTCASSSRPPIILDASLRTVRTFTSSTNIKSHIGKQVIECPATVTINSEFQQIHGACEPQYSSIIHISGPLGMLTLPLMPFVKLTQHIPPSSNTSVPSKLLVEVTDPSIKSQRAIWGLSRSLVANAVKGVSDGYNVPIRLVGVGYRATIEDVDAHSRLATGSSAVPQGTKQRLNLKLGFAHPVLVDVPVNLTASVPSTTLILISGIDKQQIGEFAARIRKWRKPEPYNGKGIFVGDETVRRKEVKKK